MHNSGNIFSIIDSLSVSKGWKEIFKKIQVAYYHNFYQGKANNIHLWRYGQSIMNLAPDERFKFFTKFNFFALVFGPLYYLAKLILPKGLILLLLEAGILYYANNTFNSLLPYLCILIHIYASIFANIDYFSKMVLNHKKIKENPDILSDYIDDNFVKSVTRKQSLYYLFTFIITIAFISTGFIVATKTMQTLEYKSILDGTKRICSTRNECTEMLRISSININGGKQPVCKEYYILGAAYYELGDKHKALNALNQAIAKNNKYLPAYLLKGIVLTELKQYNSARKCYESALKLYPEGKLFYLMGSTYYKESNFIEAKENFEKAVRAYPNNATYLESLAYAKIYLRDNQGAKEDLKKAVKALKNEGENKNSARIERIEGYMRNIK